MNKLLFFLASALFTLASPVNGAEIVNLSVPHIWEIPDGVWVPPWSGACEEASIAMVDQYYLKSKSMSFPREKAKSFMQPFFAIENKLFGQNIDTSATENAKLINDYTNYEAIVKINPTLEEIKNELRAGHPVITHHYGYDLNNPLHRFRRGGSSYHVMVLVGFDDEKKEFFVNDSELKNGIDFRYTYDTIMNTLHDFNHKTKQADGKPVVIFTRPKQLVKAPGKHSIYLIRNGAKHYISHPRVFGNHRWSWNMVSSMNADALAALPNGPVISK